jgi:hypothetical protein
LAGAGDDVNVLANGLIVMTQEITPEQWRHIDELLLAACTHRWMKVAYVVGTVMSNPSLKRNGMGDVDFAARIKHMVKEGKLLSQGNLEHMRFSEVKLPS